MDRIGQANPLPPLTVRWAVLIAVTIMACLFVYWTVRAVRSEEIRVPIRGSTLLFRRRQDAVFYSLAIHLVSTAIAVALVAMLAITGKLFG
jgi:hypothetical protein